MGGEFDVRRSGRVILHGDTQVHGGGIFGDVCRSDVATPLADVDGGGFDEPDVSIDAAARIPARGIGWIVETDGEDVFGAGLDEGSKIEAPRNIAVRPAADELAVQPDAGIGHRAIHVEIQLLSFVGGRNGEVFTVPPNAPPRKLSGFAGIFLLEGAFDAPIVRQVEPTPTA